MSNRFVVKFTKTGYVKYTSHLDLLRVFKRTFSIADIKLKYSQGFNPHPKMGFAQPLSLGYSSKCELIEFETREEYSTADIIKRLSGKMPIGVDILECSVLDIGNKSLAGECESAEYKIWIPTELEESKLKKLLDGYLKQPEIKAFKKMKKTKDIQEVPIKHMIRSITAEKVGDFALLRAHLDSGSQSNLSPELIIQSFNKFANINTPRYECEVERTALHFTNNLQF